MKIADGRCIRSYRAGICAILFAAGCGPSQQESRTVDAWLDCDECINGERDSVVALGDSGIDLLANALKGPSAERQQIMRDKFAAAYPAIAIAALTQNQYVSRLLANYVASYQRKAAIGLASIGGSKARGELDAALAAAAARGYREDVVRTIKVARQTIGAAPFPGTIAPVRVQFGDTVTLTSDPSEPFTLDELALVDESPFSPGDVLVTRTAQQLKFLAVARAGPRTVAITNAGATTNTQLAVLTISSLLDPNDRRMLSCTDLSCQVTNAPSVPGAALPYVSFLSLWRIGPRMDTVDLFRIQPAGPLQLTAQLDWSDSGNLDLSWASCSTLNTVGNSNGATANNPEESTVLIPAGECWVLLVVMRAGGSDRALARVRLTSP